MYFLGETVRSVGEWRMDSSPRTLVTKLPNGEDKIIESSRIIRLLVGNLQEDLTWRGKKSLLPALRSKIGALKLVGKNLSEEGCLCLANGMIISKLLYLLPVWGGTHPSNMKKLNMFSTQQQEQSCK